jgi:tRNA wybutosine-synthesizing protein 2
MPSEKDFKEAFWVSTKQNGLYQTWAPRYTMFSRGNIKEKARMLSFHDMDTAKTTSRKEVRPFLPELTAADLYAGIGYFVFSYAQMGIGKVLCWEINPWSVEGLRRGIEMNGWSYTIIKGEELTHSLQDIAYGDTHIIIFEESNEYAPARIEELRNNGSEDRMVDDIIHVNCGFLPSSEASWETAWKILCKQKDGWLHLHENVGVDDIGKRAKEIESNIGTWARSEGLSRSIEIEHVELVKTFAPGVWHVVFDVHVQPGSK